MEEITLTSVKTAVEWIFEANFAEERPELLNLIITSPGGDLNAAFALIDTMRGSAIPIRTIGLGQIASAGLMIFIAGDKGHRLLTPTLLSYLINIHGVLLAKSMNYLLLLKSLT
jgi:ATP-dependent protease ClpP protease subunit